LVKKKKANPERIPPKAMESPRPEKEKRPFPRCHLIAMGLIIALALIAYSNTFYSPFHFDDESNITKNLQVQLSSPREWGQFLTPGSLKSLRAFTVFTFALNYYVGGLDPFGFHVTNLFVHILTGLLLYGFLWLTLRLPSLKGAYASIAFPISLLSSLLFIVHPIQIQAVTYIVQRHSSLATLCFLFSMTCYVRARLSFGARRWGWSVGTLLSGILALYSKENTLVLPVFIGLYEFLFFQEGKRKTGRKTLVPVLLGLGLFLLITLILWGDFLYSVFIKYYGFTGSPWSHRLLTQCRVFLFYISLLIYPLPSRFCIDHDFSYSLSLFHPPSTLPAFLFVLGLLAFALWRLRKNPLVSYFILWFYGNLLLESIIAIDMVFEHRLYRSAVSAFLLFSLLIMRGLEWVRQRHPEFPLARRPYVHEMIVVFLLVLPLTIFTIQRNEVWKTTIGIWEDALRTSPLNPRAYINLGVLLERENRYPEALQKYQRAIQIAPHLFAAHFNLSHLYRKMGRYDEAVGPLRKAIQTNPLPRDASKAYHELGLVYQQLQRYPEAIEADKKASQLQPNAVGPWVSLGGLYARLGQYEEAIESYKKALSLDPKNAEASNDLSLVYQALQRPQEAIQVQKGALRANPQDAEAHNNLGIAYRKSGQIEEAVKAYREALRLRKDYPEAYNNLGLAYYSLRRFPESVQAFQEAIRLKPGEDEFYYNLGVTYNTMENHPLAVEAYEKALRIKPAGVKARYNLGASYATLKKRDLALEQYTILKDLDQERARRLLALIQR